MKTTFIAVRRDMQNKESMVTRNMKMLHWASFLQTLGFLLIRISLGKSCTISVFDALKGLLFRMKILRMDHGGKSQKSSLHPYACLYIRAVGAMPNEYLGITFTYFQACICIRL